MRKNSWDILFDHLRFDFGIKGIIVYNSRDLSTKVSIVGYPYVREDANNDNEAKR